MNPFQKNKVDISVRTLPNESMTDGQNLSAEEQRVFRLYGKLPDKKDLFKNKLQERKYFDSGDYAMSKAGKASEGGVTSIGSEHPVPENIPHLSSPVAGVSTQMPGAAHPGLSGAGSGSPVKESSFLQREAIANDPGVILGKQSPTPPSDKSIPIRR